MISVIIPTRSRKINLVNTVSALVNQTLSKDQYEIIISDDNSTDNSFEVYEQFKSQVRMKYVNNNTKPHTWDASTVRNLGASISSRQAQWLVFVDSDVILPNSALQHYVDDLIFGDQRVIIGPYHFYAKDGERIQVSDVRWPKFESSTPEQTFDTVHDGLACFGGNLLIPKNIFWDVGGFDEDVFIGLEDGSMGLKLWKRKTSFSYDKRLLGRHQWHEIPPDRFPPDMKQHIDKLNLKHFHTQSPDYGIIEASRDTYASWGIDWVPPESWLKNQLKFMEVNHV